MTQLDVKVVSPKVTGILEKPPNSETLRTACTGWVGSEVLKLSRNMNSSIWPLMPPSLHCVDDTAVRDDSVCVSAVPSIMTAVCEGENLTARECHVLRVSEGVDENDKSQPETLTEILRSLVRETAKT